MYKSEFRGAEMIKKFYDKCPILYGVLFGQGLFVFFLLLEYFLVSTGISECGVVTDSFIRIMFGIFALILMKKITKISFVSSSQRKFQKAHGCSRFLSLCIWDYSFCICRLRKT